MGIATTAEREVAEPLYGDITKAFPGGTANFFPGTNNDAAPDGPDDGDKQTGYLWDAAVRAGLTVRNYGYYIDLIPYSLPAGTPGYIPPTDSTPYANNDVQAYSTNPTLRGLTDPYFRSFDNNYPDFWRYNEWKREFDNFVTNGDLPNLTFLRFMHDHMGDFHSAQGGINTPEAQQADDDYAVGLVADAVAHSKYRGNTLIFVVEDDAQDGPDHVDAHRSTAYIVGPYVKAEGGGEHLLHHGQHDTHHRGYSRHRPSQPERRLRGADGGRVRPEPGDLDIPRRRLALPARHG